MFPFYLKPILSQQIVIEHLLNASAAESFQFLFSDPKTLHPSLSPCFPLFPAAVTLRSARAYDHLSGLRNIWLRFYTTFE